MKKIFITGTTGFIGKEVCRHLVSNGYKIIGLCRRLPETYERVNGVDYVIGDVTVPQSFSEMTKGCFSFIHLAARAHVIKEISSEPLSEFRKINVTGTLNLAHQAVTVGAQRFVFISSIGVNGNRNDCPFTEDSLVNPIEPYAVSKMEAEKGLQQIAEETGLEVVIIRPPLVYGPNAPGNFGRLFRAVNIGIPLPLGSIHNKRSFVALENLVDLIVTCINHPRAANQVFLAGDGEDISTSQLLRRMGKALGKSARLIPVPERFLKVGLNAVGKRDIAQRLCGSLQVDISKARNVLGWEPPVSVDEGLKKTAEWYKNRTES